jgi:ketosteroid isomerase-like protein
MSDIDSPGPIIDRVAFGRIIAALLELRPRPGKLAPLFAAEACWHMNGDPASWAYAGKRCDRDSILAYLEAFAVEYEQLETRLLTTVIEGEQACIQYEMRVRHRGTGRVDTIPCLCFIRVEGELIVEGNEFVDTATLFRLRDSGP